MRVVGSMRYGGPDALEIVELPVPEPGPGEVRVRVHAAAVNPTDTFVRNGARAEQQAPFPRPYVPGMDAAGVLDAIDPDTATDLVVGDRVMAILLPQGNHGAYAEYVVCPAESVTRAPAGTTHAEAATLPMNGLTAQMSLDQLALPAGATLAVTGAAGCYGGYVVQLAHHAGLRVIADAAPQDMELVRSLGADVVLPRGDDLAERVRALVPGGVDAVADGAVMNALALPMVRDGGGFATVRGWDGPSERGITIHPTWVREYLRAHAALDRLRLLAEQGVVTLRVAAVLPAADAAEAHRRLEAGGTRGRFVLEF